MPKIHVLESNNGFAYKIAIHFDVPVGTNEIGLTWKACGLASNMTGSTVLTVGTEPGNITQAEHDSIVAGDTIEIVEIIQPGLDPTNGGVEALADIRIDEWEADMGRILKYYGHTIAGE